MTLSNWIGMTRAQALYRATIGVIWWIVATLLLVLIWFPIAVILGVIDLVVFELLMNREGFVPDSTLSEPYWWWVENTHWVLFSKGSFDLLPYV